MDGTDTPINEAIMENHIESWAWFERLTHFLPYEKKTEIGTMGFHRLLEELKDARVNIKSLDDAITDTLVYVSGLAKNSGGV